MAILPLLVNEESEAACQVSFYRWSFRVELFITLYGKVRLVDVLNGFGHGNRIHAYCNFSIFWVAELKTWNIANSSPVWILDKDGSTFVETVI